jgi:chitinase
VPAGLNATINGATVTFTASEYAQDTSLLFTVTVSDAQATSSASATVVVAKKDTGGGTCTNAWDSGAVYNGGDQVTWDGKVWEAKWWTQGDDPSQSGQWGVWKEVGPANC